MSLDELFNSAESREFSWWSSRVGEESPLLKAFDAWGTRTPPPRGSDLEPYRKALVDAVVALAKDVAEQYPTDLCGVCGR